MRGFGVVFLWDPFVLQGSFLPKPKPAARGDNPTLPVSVSQEFTYNGSGAYVLHYHTHTAVLHEGWTETSPGPQQE